MTTMTLQGFRQMVVGDRTFPSDIHEAQMIRVVQAKRPLFLVVDFGHLMDLIEALDLVVNPDRMRAVIDRVTDTMHGATDGGYHGD